MNRGMDVDTLRLVWKLDNNNSTVNLTVIQKAHLLRGEVDVVDDHVCDLQCLVLVRLLLLSALLEQIWRNKQILTMLCFLNC